MNPWQATFFGLKQIPRELTAFEIEAFFTFTATERQDRVMCPDAHRGAEYTRHFPLCDRALP